LAIFIQRINYYLFIYIFVTYLKFYKGGIKYLLD
jgi:hypothetical protein